MLKTISFVAFDGDGDGKTGDGDGKTGDGKTGDGDGKTFTQEDVNTIMAREKRKTQEAQKQHAAQLEQYKKTAQLTTEERAKLEAQIDDLQSKSMTVEEKARRESEKAAKTHQAALDGLTTERDSWQNQYTNELIGNKIALASAKHKAENPEHIDGLIRSRTKVAPVLDPEGNATGRFEARVAFPDTDKENKPITLDLTVDEAVKRMTELPQHQNLFAGGKAGGLGASGGQGGKIGTIDVAKMAREDPAGYRKLRKEKPEEIAKAMGG